MAREITMEWNVYLFYQADMLESIMSLVKTSNVSYLS